MLHKLAGDDSPSCVVPLRGGAPGRGRRLQFHHRPHPVGTGPAEGRGGRRRDQDRPRAGHARRDMDDTQPHRVRKKESVWARLAGMRAAGHLAPAAGHSRRIGRIGVRRMPGRMGTIDHPGVCAGRRMHGSLPYVIMIGSGRRTATDVLEDVGDDVPLPSSNISFRRLAYGRRPAFRSRNEGNQIGGRRRRCATSGLSFRRLAYGRRSAFRSRNEGNQTRRSRFSRTSLARGTPGSGCRRREAVRCFDGGDQE